MIYPLGEPPDNIFKQVCPITTANWPILAIAGQKLILQYRNNKGNAINILIVNSLSVFISRDGFADGCFETIIKQQSGRLIHIAY
jgi:hypothetical protein